MKLLIFLLLFYNMKQALFEPTDDLFPKPGVCGYQILTNKIIGGNETAIDEYPWMALIVYKNEALEITYGCGGSLINNRYVITAAHCVILEGKAKEYEPYSVILGEWDIDTIEDCSEDGDCADPTIEVQIDKFIVHTDYKVRKIKLNDIALLRLKDLVNYTDFIKPICLPFDEKLKDTDFLGKVLYVTGWGKTETKAFSNRKLKADVFGLNCSRKLVNPTLQICAGGNGSDTCQGDSGGPLMFLDRTSFVKPFNILIGITSFGSICGGPVSGVYTKVTYYINWIKENVQV